MATGRSLSSIHRCSRLAGSSRRRRQSSSLTFQFSVGARRSCSRTASTFDVSVSGPRFCVSQPHGLAERDPQHRVSEAPAELVAPSQESPSPPSHRGRAVDSELQEDGSRAPRSQTSLTVTGTIRWGVSYPYGVFDQPRSASPLRGAVGSHRAPREGAPIKPPLRSVESLSFARVYAGDSSDEWTGGPTELVDGSCPRARHRSLRRPQREPAARSSGPAFL